MNAAIGVNGLRKEDLKNSVSSCTYGDRDCWQIAARTDHPMTPDSP